MEGNNSNTDIWKQLGWRETEIPGELMLDLTPLQEETQVKTANASQPQVEK